MKRGPYAIAAGVILFAGALTFVVLRGEDTRSDLRVVERTVDPCHRPESEACQRRIRLVLRELVRRHPNELRKLGLRPRNAQETPTLPPFGGGGAGSPPSGGGPVGRVPSPGSPPAPTQPPKTPAPPSEPLVDLDAPLVPRVCVGDLLAVNCR